MVEIFFLKYIFRRKYFRNSLDVYVVRSFVRSLKETIVFVAFKPLHFNIKYHFWTVVRYRKIPPAAAANQIAEKKNNEGIFSDKAISEPFFHQYPGAKLES